MGQQGGPGAVRHFPGPAGSSPLEEALSLKATTPIPPSQRRTHMARPAWPEAMGLLVTPRHEPPTLVPPPRSSSAPRRPGGNSGSEFRLRETKPCSFLCTFGVEGHAQPGTLGWALVRLEVLPHKDVLHLVLDRQHRATNCEEKSVREEPGAWRPELRSSSAREDKAEEPCTKHVGVGELQQVTVRSRWLTKAGLGHRDRGPIHTPTGILGTPSSSISKDASPPSSHHSPPIPFWHLLMASFCPSVISMWKV